MARSSTSLRGGSSRIARTYRLAARVSYKASGTLALVAAAGCGFSPAMPPNAVVSSRIPAAWTTSSRAASRGGPKIIGVRFSSLDVSLGSDWSGDVITSPDVTGVDLFTNIYDISTIRIAPGHFAFDQHVVDEPAFIVRLYALDVIARDAAGRSTRLAVPFRIRGRVGS